MSCFRPDKEQILTLLYLPFSTLVMRAASTIFMPVVWRGHDFNPRPTAPEADALPLLLSGPVDRWI